MSPSEVLDSPLSAGQEAEHCPLAAAQGQCSDIESPTELHTRELIRQEAAAERTKQEEANRLLMETQRLESERLLQQKQDELSSELQKVAERHAYEMEMADKKIEQLLAAHSREMDELQSSVQAEATLQLNSLLAEKKHLEASLQESTDMVSILEQRVEQLTVDLLRGEEKFSKAQQKLSEQMNAEIDRLTEVVSQRERSLQSSNVQLSELTRQNEEYYGKIAALTQTVEDYKARSKQLQAASASESDMRKELLRLQEEGREKDASLAAFHAEGQALAKKQV